MQVYATLGPRKGIALEKMIALRFILTPLKIKRPARVGPDNGVAKDPRGDRTTRAAPAGTKGETGTKIDHSNRGRTRIGTAIEHEADLVQVHSTEMGVEMHGDGKIALIGGARKKEIVQTGAANQPAAKHLDRSIRGVGLARRLPPTTRNDLDRQTSPDDLLPSK